MRARGWASSRSAVTANDIKRSRNVELTQLSTVVRLQSALTGLPGRLFVTPVSLWRTLRERPAPYPVHPRPHAAVAPFIGGGVVRHRRSIPCARAPIGADVPIVGGLTAHVSVLVH